MTDLEAASELPESLESVARSRLSSTDQLRMGMKSLERREASETDQQLDSGFGGRVVLQAARQKAEIPDNAVNIQDRSEAPEDAEIIEGDRGGLYYVPKGEGEKGDDDTKTPEQVKEDIEELVESAQSDSEVIESVSDYASNATGAEVNLTQFDSDRAVKIAEQASVLGVAGETDGVTAITGDVDAEMTERGSAGNYNPVTREVQLNPDILSDETIGEWGETGQMAGGDIEHVVAHEVGHHNHLQQSIDGENITQVVDVDGIPDNAVEGLAEQVSVYGVTNPYELVAEVYAMKVNGDNLSTGVENAYETFHGPEVNV